jgi:hypothetical protein
MPDPLLFLRVAIVQCALNPPVGDGEHVFSFAKFPILFLSSFYLGNLIVPQAIDDVRHQEMVGMFLIFLFHVPVDDDMGLWQRTDGSDGGEPFCLGIGNLDPDANMTEESNMHSEKHPSPKAQLVLRDE